MANLQRSRVVHRYSQRGFLERWGFTRSTAYRNIRAANVARVLQNARQDAPPSQARALGTPTRKSKLTKPMPPTAELLKDEFAESYEHFELTPSASRSDGEI